MKKQRWLPAIFFQSLGASHVMAARRLGETPREANGRTLEESPQGMEVRRDGTPEVTSIQRYLRFGFQLVELR